MSTHPGPALPNLRHLRVLHEALRCGSLSAAARAAHLSQPAATQAIGALERELGVALLARSSRGVGATPEGERFAARAARALAQLGEAFGALDRRPAERGLPRDPLRSVTSPQLIALIAVVEDGGFGRAARGLRLARPTVHRATRQLEAALGVPMFEWTSHGLRPTRDAERLARAARLAATELDQARAELAALTGREEGRTVIGAMPLARSQLVPSAVLMFLREHPRHTISILDGPYESMLEALRRGSADVLVGALRDAAPADVVQEPLFDDPLSIILRAGHPILKGRRRDARAHGRRGRLDARDLAPWAWIAPRPGSPLRERFEALRREIGTDQPAAPIECNSLVAARALLLESDRIMLLSAHQVSRELERGELVALPHPDGRVLRRIGLTVRRDWHPTRAQQGLIEALRRRAALSAAAPVASRNPERTIG